MWHVRDVRSGNYRILVGKRTVKRPLGTSSLRFENNTIIDHV